MHAIGYSKLCRFPESSVPNLKHLLPYQPLVRQLNIARQKARYLFI